MILGIQFNDEQYQRKLQHSCNFDKKQRLKTNFLSIKLYIGLIHAKSHFKWLLAWITQIYSFIDKIFLFDLWFLSKLQLCLTFW